MNGVFFMSSRNVIKIAEKPVHIEWSYRGSKLTDSFQAKIEGLVS